MKHLFNFVAVAVAALMFTACNNNGNQNANSATGNEAQGRIFSFLIGF